jgi:hypothetical protein
MAAALWTAGCASKNQQAAAPGDSAATNQSAQTQPVKLTPEQELTKYCRVCVVDKGERIEEFFPSRLDTQHGGKTYKFCSDDCKKKFDASSKRYALK